MSSETEISGFRQLSGIHRKVLIGMSVTIVTTGILYVIGIHLYLGVPIIQMQYIGWFMGLTFASAFLVMPPSKSASRSHVPWFDYLFAGLALTTGLYVAIMYPWIIERMAFVTPFQYILGTVVVILVLEAIRRFVGWFLFSIVVFFIFYALFSDFFPGAFGVPGVSWGRLAPYLYLDTNALMGLPLRVGSTLVLSFVLFGNVLFACGGGEALANVSLALMGRFRGGPAKVAVIASCLFGTMSGSTIANVMTTGSVTIPMMKNAGFKKHIAGAIEAAASNGGQIAPPVLGVTAFLIAEMVGMPYSKIALAATLPAILYFLALLLQVDLEAAKENIKRMPPSDIPPLLPTLARAGWVAIPLMVIIYFLFFLRIDPSKAALGGTFATLIIGMARSKSRRAVLDWRKWVLSTGGILITLGPLMAGAAIVIGTVNISGLGVAIPMQILDLTGGKLAVITPVLAILCMALGAGLPTAAVYIVVATLGAPVLVEAGLEELAAHMFVFYYGLMAMVTPPVCMAAYAAASLAGSNPMRTGWSACRLSMVAYIVPFVFIFNPALLLLGTPGQIAYSFGAVTAGISFLVIGTSGFFLQRLGWAERMFLIACGGAITMAVTLERYLGDAGYVQAGISALAGLLLLFKSPVEGYMGKLIQRQKI